MATTEVSLPSLPPVCSTIPNFDCFSCLSSVYNAYQKCKHDADPLSVLHCMIEYLESHARDCLTCLCNSICWLWPHSSLCTLCTLPSGPGIGYWKDEEKCPSSYTLVGEKTKVCAQVQPVPKNFDDAESNCDLISGGSLIKANTSVIIDDINKLLRNTKIESAWIGAKAITQDGFSWVVDNSDVENVNFCPGFPSVPLSDTCLVQENGAACWQNIDCTTLAKGYVCQVNPTS